MSKVGILKEYMEFLAERKKILVVFVSFFLLLLGALIVATEGSVIGSFIYTLF